MNNEKTVSVLNDLLNITNDRIQGFSKVEDKVWDQYPQLRADYDTMVSQSHTMKNELTHLITERGGTPEQSGSTAGAIHRAWIDIKNSFAGDSANATLGNVVYGEKAAIDAYEKALESGDLCPQSSQVVLQQLHQLKTSHDKFQNLEEIKK
ncbi:PA2169 family four-helix-bundle protein [Chryseobacterium sp.]|uniref:ferritin-like domain-containing protein n=1 Tax=Chryseobacterium sp. TaxID=1871047 RepID=UPI0025BAE1C8|nr:PA2169 family four-helix-bundle protein [Chryseobacterium sp.]MBV8325028.1 PA2169 family four-helix-bundle protein [Chryseobacterium sp.]